MTAIELRSVTVERDIPHPPEKIWRALTTQHLIEEWLMRNDFGLDLGHRFQLCGDWGHVDCEVLAVDPGRSLSYTWNYAHDDPAYRLDSKVTFTLEPSGSGTLLRMEQVGFRPDQKQAFGGAKSGWRVHLENLEKLVAGLD
ncbi:SRPBCC domain-containing protein [Sphingopyxis sp. J-6]|uniref:SRPBCC family protein n=1 Tax=Sphingopyxis sp. J-6 TaxID=3122054 RepID=UPI00398415DD